MGPLISLVLGIIICVAAGLLALVPDIERPWTFVPSYLAAVALFLGGLALILWCQPVGDAVASYFAA